MKPAVWVIGSLLAKLYLSGDLDHQIVASKEFNISVFRPDEEGKAGRTIIKGNHCFKGVQHLSFEALLICNEHHNSSSKGIATPHDMPSNGSAASAMSAPENCSQAVVISTAEEWVKVYNREEKDMTLTIGMNGNSGSVFLASFPIENAEENGVTTARFILPAGKDISLPFSLFSAPFERVSSAAVSSTPTHYANEEIQNIAICSKLQQLVHSSELSTFAVESDSSLQHGESSLAHWLDVCHIPLPVVYQYQHIPQHSGDVNRSADRTDALCTVRSITHLTHSCNLSRIEGHRCISTPYGEAKPVCLDDVMSYLARRDACQIAAQPGECLGADLAWQQCQLPDGGPQQSTVRYLSSAGFLPFLQSHLHPGRPLAMSQAMRDEALRSWRDLVTVLRAFEGAHCLKHLTVQTVPSLLAARTSNTNSAESAGSVVERKSSKEPLTRLLLKLQLVFHSDPSAAATFTAALSAVSAHLQDATSDVLDSPTLFAHALGVLDALMTVFGADFTRLHIVCATSSASFLCANDNARTQLADVIQEYAGWIGHYLNVEKVPSASVVTGLLQRCVTALNYVHTPAPLIPTFPTTLATMPAVRVFVDGDVHVLLIVRTEHVPYVQRLVTHWQQHGAEVTNFLFVRYLIIPLDAVPDGTDSAAMSSVKAGERRKQKLQRLPSLHRALAIAREKIEQIVSVKDLVYALIGLEAVMSFPQPGKHTKVQADALHAQCAAREVRRSDACDSNVVDVPLTLRILNRHGEQAATAQCNLCSTHADGTSPITGTITIIEECAQLQGVVPAIAYGGSAVYTLDAKITFSATVGAVNKRNIRAFVGLGHSIHHMLRWVHDQQRMHGQFPAEVGMQALFDQYAQEYADITAIDCHQRTFHARKARALLNTLSTSTFPARATSTPEPEPGLRASNDTLPALASYLTPAVQQSAPSRLHRSLYFADLRAILLSYIATGDLQPVLTSLQHSDEIVPLLHLETLPFVQNMATPSEVDGPGDKTTCRVEMSNLQTMLEYLLSRLHAERRVLASTLAAAAIFEQLRRCECDEPALAVDEVAYQFVRMGLRTRQSIAILPHLELVFTLALLELYEEHLLSSPAPRTHNTSACVDATGASSAADDCVNSESLPHSAVEQILRAIRLARVGLSQELSLYPDVVRAMEASLRPSISHEVQARRKLWYAQRAELRQLLANSSGATGDTTLGHASSADTHNPSGTLLPTSPRVHFVTYASEHGPGLQNLLLSAELAGIHIEVLGVGTEYTDYSSKTDAYWQYLHNSTGPHTHPAPSTSNTPSHLPCAYNGICDEDHDAHLDEILSPEAPQAVPDDDIVLFMDAYDVLVFPALANAAKVLADSPSPLLFCAERGVYPEFAGTYFYPRGVRDGLSEPDGADGGKEDSGVSADGRPSSHSSSAASQKFLNSGCILGRAGQMKALLNYAKQHGRTYRDDQLAMVRYMLEHPDQVALDSGNKLFATSFKLVSAPTDLNLMFDLSLAVNHASVGLLHCNNMNSGSPYTTFADTLRRFKRDYYSGADGELLLQAIRHYAMGETDAARALLEHPTVRANCVTMGGANPVRVHLLEKWRAV